MVHLLVLTVCNHRCRFAIDRELRGQASGLSISSSLPGGARGDRTTDESGGARRPDAGLRDFDQPPGPWTRTMRYSPMSNWSLVVALRVVPPVTPVLDCQVTVQLVVAVMGQVPVPPVRSLRDRQWNWWPQGGSAFQS